MKYPKTIIYFLAVTLLVGCSSQQCFGYFIGKNYTFRIGKEGHFHYNFYMHMIGDSSSGTYEISGDTIKFTYQTLPLDSIRSTVRYQSGLWKGKRIYPITASGQLVSTKNYWKYQNL